MLKRISLFMLTNIAVMVMVTIILQVFGIEPYLQANGINYTSLMIMCGVFGMVGSFISLSISKWSAKRMMGLHIIAENDPKYSGLVNTIHRISTAAGLPKMPEVGIYESQEVNAFATGPSKSNSLIAVSTGLLNSMSGDELEAVLAHEVSHVANGDMVTMALVQGVINAFVMFFAHVAVMLIDNLMRGDDDEGGNGLGFFARFALISLFQMIFGFLGMFVVSFFSRYREYRADSGAAKLAGRDKMIAALKKLQVQFENGAFDKETKEMNSMKISSKDGIMALLSTHPKLEDRIKALEMNA
jgi:heat shock protein HtpX